MKNWFVRVLAVTALFASANSFAAVSLVEAAELQFHKLSRLVQTKKIDAAFADHLQSLTVTPGAGNVLVSFIQEADADHAPPPVLNIRADINGKALSYEVVPGASASKFVDWSGKSPFDLFEKGMEFVADSKDAALVPFQDRITAAGIVPLINNGPAFALVSVAAAEGDGTLLITLDAQGKVLSAERR